MSTVISAQEVKSLRERTGAGMADCKKALEEAEGDVQGAIELLRKRGAATAAKRADRETREGVIVTAATPDHKRAAIVEVNCETDFVARNQEFINFADRLAKTVVEVQPADEAALLSATLSGTKDSVKAATEDLLAKFSERITITRFKVVEAPHGVIANYIHPGSKLGVLIELETEANGEPTQALGRTLAMQVAAMNPIAVDRSGVDATSVQKEIEIYKTQAKNEGKKDDIAERIAVGKLEKFYQDFVLLEQSFVKDSGKVVKDVVAEAAKELGKPVVVKNFIRFQIGEK